MRKIDLQRAVDCWNSLLQKKFPIYMSKEGLFESTGNMGFKLLDYLRLNRTFLKRTS